MVLWKSTKNYKNFFFNASRKAYAFFKYTYLQLVPLIVIKRVDIYTRQRCGIQLKHLWKFVVEVYGSGFKLYIKVNV